MDRTQLLARRLVQLEQIEEEQKWVPEDIAESNLRIIREEMEYVTGEINAILYQIEND